MMTVQRHREHMAIMFAGLTTVFSAAASSIRAAFCQARKVIIITHYSLLITNLLILLLTSCSSDDAPQEEGLEEAHFEVHAITRSGITDTGYGDIRVFLTYPDLDDIHTGLFKYYHEDATAETSAKDYWRAQDLRVKPGTRYFYLYGFMPANASSEGVMDKVNGKLTINNITPLTKDDICFVTGVVRSTKEEEIINRGYYTFKYENSDYAEQTILNLLLEHLYGRLVFKFQIGDEYSNLRKIKLKKVSIEAVAQKLNAEITLPQSSSDIVSVKYTPTGGNPVKIIEDLWDLDTTISEADQYLKTNAGETTFGSINMAVGSGISESYELVCEYEVYDRKGNKLSERTASNSLKKVLPEMGQERTVTLTIEPTYLYQLSNVDLDNPEVKIN